MRSRGTSTAEARPAGAQSGGRLCGKIRFETQGDARYTVYCHCFFCRRQTGAPVAAFAEFSTGEAFRWLRGKPATFRSSPTVARKFCRRCGTPLTFEAERYPGRIHVAISAFDDPDRFPPDAHDHVGQKISWFEIDDGLPRHHASSVSTGRP